MKKILRFTKKKRKFSPSTSDTLSFLSIGYELKERDLGKLHKAASAGDLFRVQQLIKKSDVNQLDKENRTPLHLACANGHADVVIFLVANKSKLNICDNDNRSPLMKAVQCQQERCAVILLNRNADTNLVDINGNTALHLAALIPSVTLVVHLIEHKAYVNIRNKDGFTPLLLAVIKHHEEIVEILLKEGADVNTKDKTGRTALMIAASSGQMSLVKLLLRYDADIYLTEDKGWTAEDHAMMNGYHTCSRLITESDMERKLHRSSSFATNEVKGHQAAETSFTFKGPAKDKKFQESLKQKRRTSDSEKVANDASQTDSFSRDSKGAGDSWLSSNEDDELQVSSKAPKKFNLTKLLNTSQKSKENVNANSDKVQKLDILQPAESHVASEEGPKDNSEDEDINENSCSSTQTSPQAKTPLFTSRQTAVPSASSFVKAPSKSTPFKGYKQEEEKWPTNLCTTKPRTLTVKPINLEESSTYTAQAKETPQQKLKKDLLLELGLEDMETEEHVESPWDSESATESPQKKSIASFASSPVKNQAKMQRVMMNQNNESLAVNTLAQPPLPEKNKQKSDLIVDLSLIDDVDTEDASDWDSVSASGKKVSPNVFNSIIQVNPIGKDDKAAPISVQSPKKEVSNIKTVINKSNSEETTCIHGASPSVSSPGSVKTGLTSHSSVQHQVALELQLKNTIPVKQENVRERKMSPTEGEDKEKEERNRWEMEVEERKYKHFQNGERNKRAELGTSKSTRKDEDNLRIMQKRTEEQSIQQQNQERLALKLDKGHGGSSKQQQADVTSKSAKRDKGKTKKYFFKGTVLGTDEENYESHQHNQPKQADQDLKNTALKSTERLVRLQQISTMNGDALSAFDDSTTSEMSQDDVRSIKSPSCMQFTRPIKISAEFDDLTHSSESATDGSDSPSSAYGQTPSVISHFDAKAIAKDSVTLLKVQNLIHECEREVDREKKRYALLSDKVKYLENERKELHQILDETRVMKSKLECWKMERDTDLNRVKFSLKQEEEKRKIAELLYEKSQERLQKKESQYCEELKAKQELEMMIRNMEMEKKSLLNNIEKLNEEQQELQRQFNQEQAMHKEILNNHLHRQREIQEEDRKTVKNMEEHEKDVMQKNRSLQDQLTVLKLELDCVRERNREEQAKYVEQTETLKAKLDDTKKDLKLSEEALTHTALQYNSQLNTLKTEISTLTSKFKLEKQNKKKLETEVEAIRSQLSAALQKLEQSQASKCESEEILQREHDEWHHSDEKRRCEISTLRETNSSLSQKLSKAETKANNLDHELHRATLSLSEKNMMLQSVQRNLSQSQAQINELEHTNRSQKEQLHKFTACQESTQEKLAQLQSENMLLRQQLEEAQNKSIMKEKAVIDVQDSFNNIFSKLRTDHEQQLSLVEERNKELVSKTTEQREQICKFEDERIERETLTTQLQQDLADSLKKLAMSEASLEVISRFRNEIEEEKIKLQKQLDKMKVEHQESQDQYKQAEEKIKQLQNALSDKERDMNVTSQEMQEALSATSQTKEAAKQLEERVQRLEIENAKLESDAKQQADKYESLQKELQDTASVRARLEDLITSLQGVKINLEDQLSQEVQKQTILSQNAKESHQLWEEELKMRSKLGLQLSQLSKEKDELAGQVEIERKKVKKLAEFKRSVETVHAQEMQRNSELQKDLTRMKTVLKTTKKKLKEYDDGRFAAHISGGQELDHGHSEMEATITRLKIKNDELSEQLEAESAKCKRSESTNQELSAQIASMKTLQKNQDQLEKNNQQLEEEVASLKNQIETTAKNCRDVEQHKRQVEKRAQKEIKQKLEEVNMFLQTQQASQEALEQLRATNETSFRSQFEQKIKELESDLSHLKISQQDNMNLRESAESELTKYKDMYSEELKLRKSLAAKLDRSNEKLAETNTKLLKERQRNKSLFASNMMHGGLTTTPALDLGHLQSTACHVDQATCSRNLGSNFLSTLEDRMSPTAKVESYLAKLLTQNSVSHLSSVHPDA